MEASMIKQQAINAFRDHVSYGKVAFFEKYGMNFVMGRREGPYLWNLDETNRLTFSSLKGRYYLGLETKHKIWNRWDYTDLKIIDGKIIIKWCMSKNDLIEAYIIANTQKILNFFEEVKN